MKLLIKNGFSLIELLISLLIFSVGILGLLKLHLLSLKQTQFSYWQSYADQQISNMAEEIIAMHCDGLSHILIDEWKNNVKKLPGGQGEIVGTSLDYKIKVVWEQGESSLEFFNHVCG